MTAKNGKGMSREEAAELYRDLKKAMSTVRAQGGNAKAGKKGGDTASVGEMIAREISKAMKRDDMAAAKVKPAAAPPFTTDFENEPQLEAISSTMRPHVAWGRNSAIAFVLCVATFKVALSAMEAVGFATAAPAEAAIGAAPAAQRLPTEAFSREEIKVLTALDARRAELEERSKKIETRNEELDRRDREFVSRVSELRDLTAKLGAERDRDQRKRNGQLEQLANVYGSMNPNEAAQLIEQLDVTIALGLIEKMPEKRIGQILATMKPEKALALTKLLSGKVTP
ncbi:MAG: hypothetical protein RL417_1333 [Pseudomonadota bacterium]|jgi:flagellar motility protein MotE (MotC chaperone)